LLSGSSKGAISGYTLHSTEKLYKERKEGEGNNCVRRKNENERTEGGGIEIEKQIKLVVRRKYERNEVMKCVGRKE
jgi:hypothetical protein